MQCKITVGTGDSKGLADAVVNTQEDAGDLISVVLFEGLTVREKDGSDSDYSPASELRISVSWTEEKAGTRFHRR